MKDKMELTIGICVGSSIVRSIHLLVLSDSVLILIGSVSANRHLRRATPRGDWLVVRIPCLMEPDPVC
jgi:hypothetical protein